ncbi:tetratricopeptide repeat protein [Candidatus Electronema sp. PJ]|uniref:tetratricopeptide repeat protein n=1 Tax=Candidatus Electronema sp. PJ TaxID=3401572 RepID=UPI003AA829FC
MRKKRKAINTGVLRAPIGQNKSLWQRHLLVVLGGLCLLLAGLLLILLHFRLLPLDLGVVSSEILLLLGLGLMAWNVVRREKVQPDVVEQLAAVLVAPLRGELAVEQEQLKKLAEAIAALRQADVPAQQINQAVQALAQGNAAPAQELLAQITQSKEMAVEQARQEAIAAARHEQILAFWGDPGAAVGIYEKTTALTQDDPDNWNRLGYLLLRQGKLAQAERAYNKLLDLGKRRQESELLAIASGGLGFIHELRGQLDQAEQMHRISFELHQTLNCQEGMAKQCSHLGDVYQALGKFDRAEWAHRKGLELEQALGRKEGMANQYSKLGCLCRLRGDLNGAEEMHRKSLALEQSLQRGEGIASDYGNLGNVFCASGDLDQAERLYRKGLELSEVAGIKEMSAGLWRNLGLVHELRGEFDQARLFWSNSLQLYQEINHPAAGLVRQWLNKLAVKKSESSVQASSATIAKQVW